MHAHTKGGQGYTVIASMTVLVYKHTWQGCCVMRIQPIQLQLANRLPAACYVQQLAAQARPKCFTFTSIYWGEPERAPHLMMSTAICIYMSSYGKHLPGNELLGTSSSTCTRTLITAINTGPSARGNTSYRQGTADYSRATNTSRSGGVLLS